MKRSNDLNRFSSFGLTESELNGNNFRRPGPIQQGYPDAERVGYRNGDIPVRFLGSALRILSSIVVSLCTREMEYMQ